MSELLFGRMTGPFDTVIVAMSVVGTLAMCGALAFLARRHELGWWLVTGSFLFSGLSTLLSLLTTGAPTPQSLILFAIGALIPMVLGIGLGFYGLLSFQKFPLTAPRTRGITLHRFSASTILAPLAMAAVFALASLIPVVSLRVAYGEGMQLSLGLLLMSLISGFLLGLLPAGLLGLAHRSRWAWLLIAVSALASIGATVLTARGSVLIFLFFAMAVLAFFGWGRWGSIPAKKPSRS
ncbi:hypothetical protein [Arthrobacter sp.]|uniref:hypothetical protein n=1 Tax=Arthrobacter sp. TaxID=1667 RepID=UPI0026E0AB13|nr:hypothetical protein [Arthrobacter sp.]MDO5754293.1 hypothetical protein [Arthrobacter sp.]